MPSKSEDQKLKQIIMNKKHKIKKALNISKKQTKTPYEKPEIKKRAITFHDQLITNKKKPIIL